MRARLQLSEAGPNADIAIGEMSMPIGFAVHWLAWCDRQTVKRETRFQLRQLFWPVLVTALTLPVVAVWPEVGVPVTVLVAAAGWAFTRGWNSPVNDAIRWLLAASRASRVIQRRRASAGLGGNFRNGPDHDKGEPRSWLRSL